MIRSEPLFIQGERVCFIGDSITHAGSFHSLVYLYHLTRFPSVEVTMWNCGRAGGVTNQVIERYDREIAPLRPTCAALMFGMNDCGRHRYGATRETPEDHASRAAHFAEFKLRTRLLVERLQTDGCRIILQTPTPYDQTATDRPGFPEDGRVAPGLEHVNDALARFARWLREQAPRWQADVVDYHGPLTDLTLRLQREDPGFSMTADRVHPEPCWHLLAAYQFLVQLGMGAVVSEARVDARNVRADCDACSAVTEVCREGDGVSFTWRAGALPFPPDPMYERALPFVPFHERLNQEKLAVDGLSACGRYELSIDGERVAVPTGVELASGMNLAILPQTPQGRQARELARLNDERHELNERLQDANMIDTWRPADQSDDDALVAARRNIDIATPGNEWAAKVNRNFIELFGREGETRARLESLMRALNEGNRPVPHRYRLRRIG